MSAATNPPPFPFDDGDWIFIEELVIGDDALEDDDDDCAATIVAVDDEMFDYLEKLQRRCRSLSHCCRSPRPSLPSLIERKPWTLPTTMPFCRFGDGHGPSPGSRL